MISAILLTLLAQTTVVQQGKSRDGGLPWIVECTNCSGGGGGAASLVTIDGGTVTVLQGTSPWVVGDGTGPLTVDGTVTTTPPANATTNVTQFGGNAVVTGTGTSGAGIPRVTVSSDSFPATQAVSGTVTVTDGAGALTVDGTVTTSPPANASTNVAQFGGSAVVTGTGASGAGIPRVTVSNDSVVTLGASSVNIGDVDVLTFPDNEPFNLAQVGGSAVSTAAAGVQRVGIAGNANAALDAANNATAPANVLVVGAQLQSSASATVGTAGQVGNLVAGLDHVLYTRPGGPVLWACSLDNIGATLTQCIAASGAGLRYYVTDVVIASTTATAGQFLIRTGTGANCGTGTASLFPSAATVVRYPYPGNTSTIGSTTIHLSTPVAAPAATAICIICVVTQTCTVQMAGFTAP